MANSNSAQFLLSSTFHPGEEASYKLTLTNRSGAPIRGFTLGYSGPGRVPEESPVKGATIIHQVSNWIELAPPKDFELADGMSWDVIIEKLFFKPTHWTDGAVTGVLALADGSVHSVLTTPTVMAGNEVPNKSGTMKFPVPVPAPVSLSIMPWPQKVAVSGRRTAPDGLAVIAADPLAQDGARAFADLAGKLFAGEGIVRPLEEGGYRVELKREEGLGEEAYRIDFAPEEAIISAQTRTGFLYGLISLGQILRGARLHLQSFSFPTGGIIEDNPYLAWRGCHWDVSRRFYASGEVAQFLRIMAWNKLNRFHWHLSDDEAWRIEIDAYPELTAKGAWRGYGLSVPPLLGSGPERMGGYYTKAAARELIALGETYGIEIVPEIDVPGHCYAMLEALPQLKDPGENGRYISIQGFPNNCLNPALDQVYSAIETIFGELCALFPSRYFHVGADEVPEDAWTTSPRAKALLAEKNGHEAAVLQAHFLQRIQQFLASKGKITGAWEEAADGGGIDKANCYLVGWRAVESNQKLAAEGYDVVVSPGQVYYLDMANSKAWDEPGAHWAGNSNPEETYRFTPDAGWSGAEREKLMGIQTCIWSEPMTDRGVFDRLVFPRLSAMAETAWTRPEGKSWERFSALCSLMPNLYGVWER